MRSTFSILPYINRNKVKADGTTSVLCRITIDGKSSTMATGIYCSPEDWNSRTGTIRTVRENNRLQEFRKSVGLAYDELLKKQNVVSAELLKNTLAKRAVIPTRLLQMGESERERLLARSKEINSTSTYRHSGYYQKYLKADDTKPVFPLPSRDEMWFEIHELGVAIGRKENLSYHQSRHSFGTFLISEGIPIESIAKMMGHSGIKTTQRYAE